MSKVQISIVIVNYNVKDYLSDCLDSIYESLSFRSLKVEIIVVDNASTDGSREYIPIEYPDISYIYSEQNLGFGKANNLGIDKAVGDYILLLNPDTVVKVETLSTMLELMDEDPAVWVSGCRVLNGDGTFQLACRRGFPTVWNSFCKLFGLQATFPKAKLFSGYNKLYLSDTDEYDIEAIIGAFMFFRADKLRGLNGFDPDFYMYGEDIDLCKRVWDSGGRIRYFPQTEIIHYKGESTKRSDINSIKHFYNAMEIYTRKHTSSSRMLLFMLSLAIKARSAIAFLTKYRKHIYQYLIDFSILVSVSIFAARFVKGQYFSFPDWAYPDVFVALGITHFFSFFLSGVYFEKRMNPARALQGVLLSFLLLSSLTYYFNEYAFSRGVILLTSTVGGLILVMYRIFSRPAYHQNEKGQKVELILDESLKDDQILNKLLSNKVINYAYSDGKNYRPYSNSKYVGGNYPFSINKDFFIADLVSNNSSQDVFEEFNINLPRFRFLKRTFDVTLALIALSLLIPIVVVKGKLQVFVNILKGQKSIVGVIPNENHKFAFDKTGLTDIAKANGIINPEYQTVHVLNLQYLKEYSLIKDIEIILQTISRKDKNE